MSGKTSGPLNSKYKYLSVSLSQNVSIRSSCSTGTWSTSRTLAYPPEVNLQCFSNAWKICHPCQTSCQMRQSASQSVSDVHARIEIERSATDHLRFERLCKAMAACTHPCAIDRVASQAVRDKETLDSLWSQNVTRVNGWRGWCSPRYGSCPTVDVPIASVRRRLDCIDIVIHDLRLGRVMQGSGPMSVCRANTVNSDTRHRFLNQLFPHLRS